MRCGLGVEVSVQDRVGHSLTASQPHILPYPTMCKIVVKFEPQQKQSDSRPFSRPFPSIPSAPTLCSSTKYGAHPCSLLPGLGLRGLWLPSLTSRLPQTTSPSSQLRSQKSLNTSTIQSNSEISQSPKPEHSTAKCPPTGRRSVYTSAFSQRFQSRSCSSPSSISDTSYLRDTTLMPSIAIRSPRRTW